jgi:hypothetical protein
MRNLGDQSLASQRPAMGSRHVGLCPGLIDENQPARIDLPLMALPASPFSGHVRTVLFGRVQAFF